MNCDSWEVPKNSLSEATKGLALIISFGVTASISRVFIRSLIDLSILIKPILKTFSVSSPTDLTLLLPKWSISSTSPFPVLKSMTVFMTAITSSLLRTVISSEQSKLSLKFIFTLPTSDRSYLSVLKKSELNTSKAASILGGSPGLKTL